MSVPADYDRDVTMQFEYIINNYYWYANYQNGV